MIWALFLLALMPIVAMIWVGGREDDSEADPVAH